MIDAAKLAKAGFSYLERPYSEMDCQAFVERCLRDCGLTINLPGSNAWYRKMTWVGSPEECKKHFGRIPPGAFLFLLTRDGREPEKYRKDGFGNASHIGIYTAAGKGAIHSSASRGCVAESVFRGKSISGGWNRVGLWDRIQYDLPQLSSADGLSVISENSKGEEQMITAKVNLPAGASGETVNVRTGAGKHYPIDFKIPAGSEIRIRTILDKWCLIEWNGKTGYMMSDYIRLTDASGETVSETVGSVPPALTTAQTSFLEDALTEIEKQLVVIRTRFGLRNSAAEKG